MKTKKRQGRTAEIFINKSGLTPEQERFCQLYASDNHMTTNELEQKVFELERKVEALQPQHQYIVADQSGILFKETVLFCQHCGEVKRVRN